MTGHPAAEGESAPGASQTLEIAVPVAETSAPTSADRWVKVWDLATRVFHWALVTLVACAVYTGSFTPE